MSEPRARASGKALQRFTPVCFELFKLQESRNNSLLNLLLHGPSHVAGTPGRWGQLLRESRQVLIVEILEARLSVDCHHSLIPSLLKPSGSHV